MNNVIEVLIFLIKALALCSVIMLLISILIVEIQVTINRVREQSAKMKMINLINSLSDEEVQEVVKRSLEGEK